MTALAVFVKTPRLSPLKTRLASTIGKEKAELFYQISCQWTEEVMKKLRAEIPIEAYWAVAEKEAIHTKYWKSLPTVFQGEGDLGQRLAHVYDELYKKYGSCVVLGADSPELSLEHLLDGVREFLAPEGPEFILGKTVDGGFYALGGKIALPQELWTDVSYSQATTAEEIEKKLIEFGTVKHLPLCADVDTFEDLKDVMARLKNLNSEKYSTLLSLKLI